MNNQLIKKKRCWLRGGIIGGVVGILLILLLYVLSAIPTILNLGSSFHDTLSLMTSLIIGILLIVFIPFVIIFGLITLPFRPESASIQSSIASAYLFIIIAPLAVIVGSIVYGILMGYFYGKNKNNKDIK